MRRAKELGHPESYILITAFLSERLGGDFIIVGGLATSVYSLGAYRTLDADVVCAGDLQKVKEGLELLGFKRNRVWWHEEADYAIDIVSGHAPEKTEIFEVDGYKIRVASPEDVLVNDLAGYKFWGERLDFDRALLVFKAQKDRIDKDYARKRARAKEVEDVFKEMESQSLG
ncbi:MAG: hypothetical protein AB1305_00740 [Candidatus Hadarchaeota archaeon]